VRPPLAGLLDDLPRECADLVATLRYQGGTEAEIVAEIEKLAPEQAAIRRWLDQIAAGRQIPPRGIAWIHAATRPLGPNRPKLIAVLQLVSIVLERLAERRTEEAAESAAVPKRRSHRPQQDRVTDAMLVDLRAGRISPEQLDNEKQVVMQIRYKASFDTCRKARSRALSEFVDRPTSTSDK
jgi:hypothetical protein